ncbi:MAG TPA: response regulator, partial [Planctomycetaceae bacterium]|nr:response regulator [Planctomycetaceae bacterium]
PSFASEEPGLCGTRVLIVEDNATNRETLTEMLRSWGMEVVAVESALAAESALAGMIAASAPPALALIDAGLPGSDGFSLVSTWHDEYAGVIGHLVMLLTSGDRSSDVQRCERLGVDAYLMKPVNQSELFDTLVQVLECSITDGGAIAHEPAAAAEPTELRILLAEDSFYNQKLAVSLLERRGHAVTVAGNGAEAVALAQSQTFDLVLMDVQMPEVDGLEATRLIREREQALGRRVPIVAMTAQAMKGDRERCLEAGMDDYLSKPVRAAQLYEMIARVANSYRANAPTNDRRARPAAPPAEPSAAETLPTPGDGALTWPRAWAAVDGDAALLTELAGAFLEESQQLLSEIEGALSHTDARRLHRAAHTIKGGLRMFGADNAYDLACRLEDLGREGRLGSAGEPLAGLKQSLTEVCRELSEFVETHPLSQSH